MQYRPYGTTGKDVSIVGLGGMRFGKPDEIDEMAEVVLHAYKRGVNYFDTAPAYCNDHSESIVGTAARQMTPGTFYVSTKSGKDDGGELRQQLERSLSRIGVPKIHFFHIWCVMTLEDWKNRIQGGAVAAAVQAKEEGLIEHIVVSSHLAGEELTTVLNEGPFEGVTLGYSAINFPYRQKAVDEAGRRKIGVVTMNPLAGGAIPANPQRFDFIRNADDPSVVAAALRFNLSQPAITCALVGCRDTKDIDDVADFAETYQPYPPGHVEAMREKISREFNDLCTGCQYCLPCPAGLNIPQLMDAYDYATLSGEGDKGIAHRLHWNWSTSPAAATACTQCGLCEHRCTQKLAIRDRLAHIAAIPPTSSKM